VNGIFVSGIKGIDSIFISLPLPYKSKKKLISLAEKAIAADETTH
jgi:hypothetical protein